MSTRRLSFSLMVASTLGAACSSDAFESKRGGLDSGVVVPDSGGATGGSSASSGGSRAGGAPQGGMAGIGAGGRGAGGQVQGGGAPASGGLPPGGGGSSAGGTSAGGAGTGGAAADAGGDPCGLPIEPGPCRGAFPSFGFDAATGDCIAFTYGGCEGNANRFDRMITCQAACVCALPRVSGPCLAYMPSFGYDPDTQACVSFVYGGCGGNGNRFSTKNVCEAVCVAQDLCRLPSDTGPCDGALVRYFHNAESGQCEPFSYGGCGGNDNNFATEAECRSACGPAVSG